jgi:hypothetical protein
MGSETRNSSAHSEILTAMAREKIKILVVTRAEILLLSSPDELVALLRKKLLKLTLERVVQLDL